MYYTVFKTHLCNIILVGNRSGLCYLHLDTNEGRRGTFIIDPSWKRNDSFFIEEKKQIEEFFLGIRRDFDIKISPKGTEYQKKIWSTLREIPFNHLATYKDIAIATNNPKGARAVGMANSKNPLPLIIPCHRVIGSNGRLTGFAHGLTTKEKLIKFENIISIYQKLADRYGDKDWWVSPTQYQMMVGAILTQNTTWINVEKAINSLGKNLNPLIISHMKVKDLALLIKPSGYYNQKAKKIKTLTEWYKGYEYNVDKIKIKNISTLREELLNIHGVGRETADSILTYALEKPSFIIDTYTKRLFDRLGFEIPRNYDDFKDMFESCLPKDLKLFQKYHGLIVEHCKKHCNTTPKCSECPLIELCKKVSY